MHVRSAAPRWRLHDGVAAAACQRWAHVADHADAGGHELKLLEHILTELLQVSPTGWVSNEEVWSLPSNAGSDAESRRMSNGWQNQFFAALSHFQTVGFELVASNMSLFVENRGRTDPLVHKLVHKIIIIGQVPVFKGFKNSHEILHRQVRRG